MSFFWWTILYVVIGLNTLCDLLNQSEEKHAPSHFPAIGLSCCQLHVTGSECRFDFRIVQHVNYFPRSAVVVTCTFRLSVFPRKVILSLSVSPWDRGGAFVILCWLSVGSLLTSYTLHGLTVCHLLFKDMAWSSGLATDWDPRGTKERWLCKLCS